jgi:hypothetical protein
VQRAARLRPAAASGRRAEETRKITEIGNKYII